MAALPLPRRKVPMFGLEAVWRDGKVVGHIRRADFGFAIDKTIAYGYIRDPAGGPVSAATPPPPLYWHKPIVSPGLGQGTAAPSCLSVQARG